MATIQNKLTKLSKGAKANKILKEFKRQTPKYLNEVFKTTLDFNATKISRIDKRKIKKVRRDILKNSNLKIFTTYKSKKVESNNKIESENKSFQNIKVGSFCTGMGAMPTALKETGIEFDFEYSCEIDKFCHQTIRKNFPSLKKQYGDIFDIDPLDLPYVDILEAGFPCTAFSIAGLLRGFSDEERGTIIFKLIDIIKSLIENNKAPKTILLENVKNLISHDKQTGTYDSLYNEEYRGKKQIGHSLHVIENLFQRFLEEFYDITWNVENTLEYGLPHNRERWFGVMTLKNSDFTFNFDDMEKVELTTCVKDYLDNEQDVPSYYYIEDAMLVPGSENKYKGRGKIEVLGDLQGYSYGQSKRLQGVNKAARCQTTGECSKYLVDPINFIVRTLTVNEKLKLHGFPTWFKWSEKTSKTQKHKQLGNTISVIVLVAIFKILFKHKLNNTQEQTHIIKKSIINNPDMKYLNITSKKYQKYMEFLANGGKLFLEITKYENKFDKSNQVNSRKITIEVNDLLPKGYRNKKQEVRRYKIISNIQVTQKPANNADYKTIDKTLINPKNDVLYPWLGSKREFTPKIHRAIDEMNMDKVEYFIDAFGGSMNFTINNIEKVKAKYYVLNDLDPLLTKVYKAVKQNYKKVSRYYLEIMKQFLQTIPEQYVKNSIDEEYRPYCQAAKEFFINTVNRLNFETDIYKIAAIFIWKMQFSSNAVYEIGKNNKIKTSGYNWKFKTVTKLKHIKYYSQVLNKYDVIIENLDVFELVNKYSHQDTFIYLDPPYLNTDIDYDTTNSDEFQMNLINETNHYKYRLYSNEDCKKLYDLGIDNYFIYSDSISRKTNLGTSNKNGKEYLAFSINEDINMRVA